jgi:hypothetical protein
MMTGAQNTSIVLPSMKNFLLDDDGVSEHILILILIISTR